MAPRHRQLSSTPLEILLFLNGWYYATYFLLEIFIFVYKGLLLPYPSANLALDLVMLFLYLGIEVTRIFFVWIHTENLCGLCCMKHFMFKGSCMKPHFHDWPRMKLGSGFLGKMKEDTVPLFASGMLRHWPKSRGASPRLNGLSMSYRHPCIPPRT
ncbi:transmembrane protein 216 isoform X1 [Python bivittatus]|uniref:Transmembrane protein 216 n=1 Tax=Python bivittatus TaxID=176946 RepID=A0A9F3W0Y5_PYTBI|nr:transmembrane protein 216 isoform X1 [Python bivittatus]